ncbi:unnamed protein product, partial [Polarella glacialis]
MRKTWYKLGALLSFLGVRKGRLTRAVKRLPLGREDQHLNIPGALPQDKPAVLSDLICLIPGDDPVVRVEDAPGNARRIYTGIDIQGSVDDVWSVLTDYAGLARVVPNLTKNEILQGPDAAGGARLWQIGRSSWSIFGKKFYFQAGTTLDVRLHPEGMCKSGFQASGASMDAAKMTSHEAREFGKKATLVRDVFPRPFSIAAPGIPIRDITMQNVLEAKGDFVHYQGVWRFQPLDSCAPPGEKMMRLTFAVECEPLWFLPVAPVEGRIAAALSENMEAIRDYVEAEVSRKKASLDDPAVDPAAAQDEGAEPHEEGKDSSLPSSLEEASTQFTEASTQFTDWFFAPLKPHVPSANSRCRQSQVQPGLGRRHGFGDTARGIRSPLTFGRGRVAEGRAHHLRALLQPGEVLQLTEDMIQALSRAEYRLMERVEPLLASDETMVAVTSTTTEVTSAMAATAELYLGLEAETVITASAMAAVAALAARSHHQNTMITTMSKIEGNTGTTPAARAWRAVLEQHPEAVAQKEFLGMAFGRKEVEQRWARFVQTLGISEEQALKMIQMDATPLLVESEGIAEVLTRLAAISSREKAMELIGKNPSLLVGGAAGLKVEGGFAVSALVDVLYAGRLLKVLEEEGRDNEGKLKEIELYSCVLSGFKPLVNMVLCGLTARDASDATRRLFRTLELSAPNESLRVLLCRVAKADDPWAYLADQTRAGLFMASKLAAQPSLTQTILPHSGHIISHLPSIYTRLSILGPHVPSIVRILDQYLDVVEPHLDRIMERMDRIEPHLPYILLHLDVLAKHCGPLLDYFDELMPYAEDKDKIGAVNQDLCACFRVPGVEDAALDRIEACVVDRIVDRWEIGGSVFYLEQEKSEKTYLPMLVPYVDFLVPRLELLAPLLPLVHPHIPYVLPYMDELLPFIPRFIAFPEASKNADVLIGYLGWTLKIPLLPRILYLPAVPRMIAKLSTMLPRRFIQGHLQRLRRRYEERQRLRALA